MIRKISLFVLFVFLFLIVFSSGCTPPVEPVSAERLIITASSEEAEFPTTLRFDLSAQSNVNITDVRLHYTVDQESYAQVTSEVDVEFVPATSIDIQWDWDMRKMGGLPPGARVEYWWTVQDASGEKIETTPIQASFDDSRYSWQNLTEGMVTVYWYEGKQSFAETIMSDSEEAVARLTEDTGAFLKKPVRIYIYANSQDLQGAMIFPQEWTGGVTFTRYGVIAIGISPSNLTWGKRAIAHELTHLVIDQMTFNPYSGMPTWLDEGLAMYNEGPLETGFAVFLKKAIDENSLLSVRSLSSPFSAYTQESYLSYAESYSLVEFLITTYGQDKMLELLKTFSEGNSYDGALEKVYGFDMDGLDFSWRDYVKEQYRDTVGTTTVRISPELDNGLLLYLGIAT